ncbi:UbiA prenyltransferase family-domain-containing protein [Mycena galericulata]|nr:UbiA prenyltransferase family-domain-containing protein [Mycena galericulata]
MISPQFHRKVEVVEELDVALVKLFFVMRADFRRVLAKIHESICYEFNVFWDFTWRDWSVSVIPGMMQTVAALRSLDDAPSNALAARLLARSLTYFLLYIYAFDIANQINGIAEDRINKPDRPLPSGRVSLRGAYTRWYATTAAYLVLGAAWGVLQWTILWVVVTIFLTFCGGDKRWISKNLISMSVGSLCLLQSAWGIAAPITTREQRWALLLSTVIGAVVNIQDLRDVEGDKIAGRRTLPIVLGSSNFRWVMGGIICAAPVVCWKLDFLHLSHWLVAYLGALLAASMFNVAYRVVRGDSAQYDHKTYMVSSVFSRISTALLTDYRPDAHIHILRLHCCAYVVSMRVSFSMVRELVNRRTNTMRTTLSLPVCKQELLYRFEPELDSNSQKKIHMLG